MSDVPSLDFSNHNLSRTLRQTKILLEKYKCDAISDIHKFRKQVLLGHPEAFAFPELKAERSHFLAGIDALSGLKEDELPYYQFLIPPSTKQPFLSKNLNLLTRLAWEIAVRDGKAQESQKINYLGNDSAPGTIVTTALKKLGLAMEVHCIEERQVLEDMFGESAAALMNRMEGTPFDYYISEPIPRRPAP